MKNITSSRSMIYREQVNAANIPLHVAVIMDGNGRWAKKRGNLRIFGHKNAIQAVRDTVEAAGEIGVRFLTLYAFSTENWNRPKEEVNALMSLLVSTIEKETPNLLKNNVRLQVIGDSELLPDDVKKNIEILKQKTEHNTGLTVVLALSYSSRKEIEHAVKRIVEDITKGIVITEDLKDNFLEKYLYTYQIPDPELLIRTSGELRLSNFLLWQTAYTELYFTETLWPDFRKEDFFQAIVNYQKRERRFGKTEDQIRQ